MKKQPSKKPKRKGYTFRGDQPRTVSVMLSEAEVRVLANQHIKECNRLPAQFRKYLRDTPKLGARDMKDAKDYFMRLIGDHTKRAKELNALLPE